MKKYFILTSILALTACGGGGGGSHSSSPSSAVVPQPTTPSVPDIPAGFRSAMTQENQDSNAHVTNMKSEIVVASSTANPSGTVVRT